VTIQVFVSYRRGDSSHAAGRLVDRLDEHFKLFIDVDRIRPGADFTSVVRAAVDESDVLVAVIGLQWLTLAAEDGGRRIDQPGDWVAEEIGTALRRGTLVIPVLVDGAQMPSRTELPEALADLASRQALRIAHESFAADSRRLIETIEELVSAATPQTVNLWDDPDYPAARGAFLQELWPAAIEGFERVLHRHPRQQHVMEQLEQARRNQHLLDLDAIAASAADAGRWREVVDALQAIDALQPTNEIKERLTQAQLSLRIAELQNDVRALAKTRNWKAVLAADAELARLDADAADLEGLATQARAELLEAELAASYARAVEQLDNRDWAGAESTLVALLDRRPGYQDAEPLLTLAQRKGTPATLDGATLSGERPETIRPHSPPPTAQVSGNPPVGAGLETGSPTEHRPEATVPAETAPSMPSTPAQVTRDASASRLRYTRGLLVAVLLVGLGAAILLVRDHVAGNDDLGAASSTETSSPSSPSADKPPIPQSAAPISDSTIIWPRVRNGVWGIGSISLSGRQAPVAQDASRDSSFPVLSPDRRSVIYLQRATEQWSVWVVAADGSSDHVLLRSPAGCRVQAPAWGPGGLLALPCQKSSGADTVLQLMTLDGQVERILDRGRLGDPTFSKDGRTVVYWRNDYGSSDGGALFRISTDGNQREQLTEGGDGVDNDPVMSPDDRTVAYRTKRNGRLVIATIALPSFPSSEGLQKPHVLSPEHADEQEPSWSPDGKQIAFIQGLGDARQLLVMNANGSGRHPLTHDQEAEAAPAWSSR
jgi:hypothetical protein